MISWPRLPAAEERRRGTVLVASGDRDTFQLASDRTTILYPVRAGEMARVGPAEVREFVAACGFENA
jgi:DNA polymerase-1